MTRDEAIKILRGVHDKALFSVRNALETLIPELAENEDERVGNVIYCTIRDDKDVKRILEGNGVSVDSALTYLENLEKRKEQKLVTFEEPYNSDEYEVVENGNATCLRRKEQKPAEQIEDDEEKSIGTTLIDAFNGNARLEWELKRAGIDVKKLIAYLEQKPAEWSEDYREEDIQTRFAFYTYKDDPSVLYLSNVFVEETSRNHGFGTRILKAAEKAAEAIGAITIALKVKQDSPANAWYRRHGYGYVAFEDGYDWLEKNLEYLKPTAPKQEWSEEDRKMLNTIISDGSRGLGFDAKQVNWLKALCPQYRWKLSEQEKAALRTAIYVLTEQRNFPKAAAHLQSILDALKGEESRKDWRPSQEQMRAVFDASERNDKLGSVLRNLYDDLKKL